MVQPNWGLAGAGNALGMFQLGTQIGGGIRQQREAREQKNALTAYATNPNETTLGGVIAADPATGIRIRQQDREFGLKQQEASREAGEQRREDLPFVYGLLGTIKDEQSYQRARLTAQRYGVDTSDWGQSYDPAQVDAARTMAAAARTAEGQEALSTAGKLAADMGLRPGTPEFNAKVGEIFQAEQIKTVPFQAGGGIASVNTATGQVTPLVVPEGYAGGQQAVGRPGGGIPRLTDPAEVTRLQPGAQFYDPDGNLRQVPGGPTQPASGGF